MSDTTQTIDSVEERWLRPVNRLGRITQSCAIVASFFPFFYLYLSYGEMPPIATVLAGMGSVASAFVAGWIMEPISYFPALGTAGTYMGILAGSIGQMRVPAALVAKSVAEVQENTQEAEIVATCGIAGSIYMNIFILTLTAIGGSVIISVLPPVILNVLAAYVLPSMFGAVLAMFGGKGRIQIAIPVLLLSALLNLSIQKKWIPIPAWSTMIVTVVIGVLVARICYKMGWAKA
jgi:hypothetical protein